jgi:hypothetical protein
MLMANNYSMAGSAKSEKAVLGTITGFGEEGPAAGAIP